MTMTMGKEGKRQQAEFTQLGNVMTGLLGKRGIRGHAEISRRISARGDYPNQKGAQKGSISDESVRNYFTGQHPVPVAFMHTIVDEMNKVSPMSEQERAELQEAYLWGQGPKVSPILPENMDKAREFIMGVDQEERERSNRGGQAKDV